jgi:alpha-L-fucosidase
MKMSVYIRHLMLLLVLMTASHVPVSAGLTDNEAYDRWHADKYSMFIHFGLYSHLGGVWDGEPVRRGYSEQIQSFARDTI